MIEKEKRERERNEIENDYFRIELKYTLSMLPSVQKTTTTAIILTTQICTISKISRLLNKKIANDLLNLFASFVVVVVFSVSIE